MNATQPAASTLLSPLEESRVWSAQSPPCGMFILDRASLDIIYSPEDQMELERLLQIEHGPQTPESIHANLDLLKDVEVILSGWGAPLMDEKFLRHAPRLKAVFYGAGSIRYFVTKAFWDRKIVISSAYAANAIPVAEYTLGVILLSLKHFWQHVQNTREGAPWGDHTRIVPGNFRSKVGMISCGMVARKTLELLKPFDFQRSVYCPFLQKEDAAALDVHLCSLDEIFATSDVVSLHTPLLSTTKGMITGEHIASMKNGATFINTARGGVVRETELVEVLKQRPDITAVLDVTDPEPPAPNSVLYQLPNVVVSPHIAGSLGRECHRLGHYMVKEVKRFVSDQPLHWQIDAQTAAALA